MFYPLFFDQYLLIDVCGGLFYIMLNNDAFESNLINQWTHSYRKKNLSCMHFFFFFYIHTNHYSFWLKSHTNFILLLFKLFNQSHWFNQSHKQLHYMIREIWMHLLKYNNKKNKEEEKRQNPNTIRGKFKVII